MSPEISKSLSIYCAATLRSPISLLWLFPSIRVATLLRKFFIHKVAKTLAIAIIGLFRNVIATEAASPMHAFWSFLILRRLFLHLEQNFAWFSYGATSWKVRNNQISSNSYKKLSFKKVDAQNTCLPKDQLVEPYSKLVQQRHLRVVSRKS